MTSEKSPQTAVDEMFSQAAQMFQQALAAGIGFQQQSTKALTDIIGGFSSPQKWQEQAQTNMEQMMASAEKSMNDAIDLMTENSRTSLELLEKAFEARQEMLKGDGQARAQELWETALGSFVRNAEVIMQANNRMVESWHKMADILHESSDASTAESDG